MKNRLDEGFILNLPQNIKRQKMKYDLDVLENGLAICEIRISNPTALENGIKCSALISTGIERSIICKSLYENFSNKEVPKEFEFAVLLPKNNWVNSELHSFLIMDLVHNMNYKTIIGVDLLQIFGLSFVYNGSSGLAWLQA